MLIGPASKINILSSNVPVNELGMTIYVPDTSYSLKQELQMGNDIFESLKDDNLDTPVAEQTTLSWKYKRKANRHRMFDPHISTQTQYTNKLEYILAVSDIDIIAFFGIESKSIRVQVLNSSDVVIYDKTQETFDRDTTDWVEWTTASPEFITSIFFKDLPFLYESKLKITIDNEGSIAKCGHCVFGESKNLGIALAEPKPISSIRNVISKEKQEDGTVKTENSMTYKRVVINVLVDTSRAPEVQQILEKYTVTPVLYVASEKEGGSDVLLIFGIYKDFDMPIGRNKSLYQLEIEGVT